MTCRHRKTPDSSLTKDSDQPQEHHGDNSTATTIAMMLLLLGDSDISRWPADMLPAWPKGEVEVQGYSGATLEQVVDKFPEKAEIVIFCAGENDVGSGIEIQKSLDAIDRLLNKTFHHLIFLGPKFEPWQNDDLASRKQYTKLSKGLRRRCEGKSNVTFVDCLAMFCGDTANLPAILGGKAKADAKFFNKDQLHLSHEGYRKWKQVVARVVEHCEQGLTTF